MKKESEKLDVEIGEKWDELKKMESLIAKKAELRKKLPDLEHNPEPSAPLSSGAQTHVDVHQPPLPPPGRPSLKGPSSSTSRGK